jgi:hypothetical protein
MRQRTFSIAYGPVLDRVTLQNGEQASGKVVFGADPRAATMKSPTRRTLAGCRMRRQAVEG